MRSEEMTPDQVVKGFIDGNCCASQVLAAVADTVGISEKDALAVAKAFGSGMGHGSICGCVTGAYMAIGLKYGDDKETVKNVCRRFDERFTEYYDSLVCKEILGGVNPSEPEGFAEITMNGKLHDVCGNAVIAAVSILEDLFEE